MTRARRRLLLGSVLVALALLIAFAVSQCGTAPADARLVRRAADLRDGWFGSVLSAATTVGYVRWLGPLTVLAAALVGFVLHRWRDALVIGFATVLAALLNHLAKRTFERTRPNEGVHEVVAGFSMPSGHAAASAAVATSVMIAMHDTPVGRAVCVIAVTFALLVGLSRVVLGAHFPTDVLAGWCMGVGITLLLAVAVERFAPRR